MRFMDKGASLKKQVRSKVEQLDAKVFNGSDVGRKGRDENKNGAENNSIL